MSKFMKRIALLLALLIGFSALAGCGNTNNAGNSGDNQPEKKKIKIGVSVATMQEAVYTFMKKAMEDNAAANNAEIIWTSADNKEEKQLSDVESLLSQGIDVLILHAVNTGAAASLVAKAEAAGVPVVAMDRLPENAKVALYVTADSKQVGRIQAQYLAEQLGGKGNVIILEGEAGNGVARDITAGNKEVLAKYPDIKVVVDQAHKGWARDLAMNTVETALTQYNNNIQGILANNSGMAMGAVQALKNKGLAGKVVTIGSDADEDACKAIKAGELSADVDKKPYELGKASFLAAVELAQKKTPASDTTIKNGDFEVPVKLTPVELIKKDNVDTMKYRWPNL
ncbi:MULTISPECIES: substrate-binding domain-containing protein [unclassified Carboxydocella]|uniref:sugar ABC transporter substrate-binding protein n=1 Tax=unclassified Carboxydocella TaxID=2685367 RepID=UPI0009C5DE10|nr:MULTISPECIES: substrate-binding domain-containing protein [unclassified Carboxydocella]GAW30092.1 hypothetical protein ULO1_26620 [Carboxydocella sp. ULO1]GAW31167.1 hypothetical protein JDF658_09320 [Carboxydocella sp. JDF658]